MARILVVDDEASIRHLLREALTRDGHEVLEAGDGHHALALVRETPIALVVTDILMPVSDGLELIMALKHEVPQVKILAMSGGGQIDRRLALKMAEQLGAGAILDKPFAVAQALGAIRQALAA